MLHCVEAEQAVCLGFGSLIASQSELRHEEMSILKENPSYKITHMQQLDFATEALLIPSQLLHYSFSSPFNLKCVCC